MLKRIVVLLLVCFCPAFAWAEESIRIVKIASQDQSVLIDSNDSTLRVVHVGDTVAPYGTIVSIAEEQVVFRNAKVGTAILHFVHGQQSLERVTKINPSPQRPVMRAVNAGGGSADEASNAIGRAGGQRKK